MRKVSLLLALTVAGLSSFAQYNVKTVEKSNDDCSFNRLETRQVINTNNENRAPGDVLWSEDFENLVVVSQDYAGDDVLAPAGWTVTDDAGVGSWKGMTIDTAYTGAYTDPAEALIATSTAATPGYMHLPADFYNCTAGSWDPREMVASPVDMDATLTTGEIDVTAFNTLGVILKFDQVHRLCCSSANTKLEISVTSDVAAGVWTTFDGRTINGVEVPINESSANAAEWQTPITSIVAGASWIKISFRMQGGSHYFWSLDNVQLVQSLQNDVSLQDYYAGFQAIYTTSATYSDGSALPYAAYNTNFSEVPFDIQNPVHLGAKLHQAGLNAENVYVNFTVDSAGTEIFNANSTDFEGTPSVIANFGTDVTEDTIVYSDTNNFAINSPTSLMFYDTDASHDLAWFNDNNYTADGIQYAINYEAMSTTADDVPGNNTASYNYSQTYGRMSYHWRASDNPGYNNDIGPFSYVGYNGSVGDTWVNTFELNSDNPIKIWGVRILTPAATNSHMTFDGSGNGCSFSPVLYWYDASYDNGDGTFGDFIKITAVTGESHTINESEAGQYLYLPFDDMEVADFDFQNGTYYVGIEMDNYNGFKMAIAVDQTYRQGDLHFRMKLGEATDPSAFYYWGTGGSAMIDVYTKLEQYDVDQTGVEEVASSKALNNVTVYPNPTTGIVNVKNVENATVSVYSIAGELVNTVKSNSVNLTINLNGLAKGTYLVKVVKENEVVTKKITLIK